MVFVHAKRLENVYAHNAEITLIERISMYLCHYFAGILSACVLLCVFMYNNVYIGLVPNTLAINWCDVGIVSVFETKYEHKSISM